MIFGEIHRDLQRHLEEETKNYLAGGSIPEPLLEITDAGCPHLNVRIGGGFHIRSSIEA